jgi:hypothetical protein
MNEEQKAKHRKELEALAAKLEAQWHAQSVHQIYATKVVLDLAGVKDQKTRDKVVAAIQEGPSSLGCNASAFAQALGREKQADKIKSALSGI